MSAQHPHKEAAVPWTMHVRRAQLTDADAVVAIYNQGIRGRRATFETAERRREDIVPWLSAESLEQYPMLVAETRAFDGGDPHQSRVDGWIRASAYRPRACYAGIGDFSVYVESSAQGRGLGDALMTAFIPACVQARLWKLVSRIFPENAASLALCERHGFRVVGTYERHAQLDGVWRDVVIVERLL